MKHESFCPQCGAPIQHELKFEETGRGGPAATVQQKLVPVAVAKAERERLLERVAELESALRHVSIQDNEEDASLDRCDAYTLAGALRHCGETARTALATGAGAGRAQRGWCVVKQGPPCPLCDAPLTLPEGALVQRRTRGPRPTKLTRYVCACGVEADVGASAIDGSPAVFCFTPNRVLRVRNAKRRSP